MSKRRVKPARRLYPAIFSGPENKEAHECVMQRKEGKETASPTCKIKGAENE